MGRTAVSATTGVHAMQWIVIWGAVSLVSAALAAVFAGQKNRNVSFWTAWCFLVPPLVIWLMLMPRNTGPRPKPKPLDDLDSPSGGGLL